jgi:hypothetical protein
METILNSVEKRILQEINNSNTPEKLIKYQYKPYEMKSDSAVKGIEKIINFIKG